MRHPRTYLYSRPFKPGPLHMHLPKDLFKTGGGLTMSVAWIEREAAGSNSLRDQRITSRACAGAGGALRTRTTAHKLEMTPVTAANMNA